MIEKNSVGKKNIIKIFKNKESENLSDNVAVEEPLEIRITHGKKDNLKTTNLSVTMRTPGDDAELATGFLYSEGIINDFEDIKSINHIDTLANFNNILQVVLSENINFDIEKTEKHFYTSSSCGVCGKTSINSIKQLKKSGSITNNFIKINKELIFSLPQKLLGNQSVFENTGGLHASALFDINSKIITIKEDVGRHNALDKLIGYSLKNKLIPLSKYILLLSGRASFELIQKAALADIKIVVSIGAPSSLAIQTAEEFGITLIGFLNIQKFNIYTFPNRIVY